MNKRTFNKHLNACCKRSKGQKVLDLGKLKALPDETKKAMALYLIRNRGPVLLELVTPDIDQSWLACMGYMYKTKGKVSGFTFIHTCEHSIK